MTGNRTAKIIETGGFGSPFFGSRLFLNQSICGQPRGIFEETFKNGNRDAMASLRSAWVRDGMPLAFSTRNSYLNRLQLKSKRH